jgi:hypothetical protein
MTVATKDANYSEADLAAYAASCRLVRAVRTGNAELLLEAFGALVRIEPSFAVCLARVHCDAGGMDMSSITTAYPHLFQ